MEMEFNSYAGSAVSSPAQVVSFSAKVAKY